MQLKLTVTQKLQASDAYPVRPMLSCSFTRFYLYIHPFTTPLQDQDFRPVRMRLAAEAAGASLLLCTDRPGSFGAPDVVEVALDRIALDHSLDARFSDRPPDQVG